MDSKKMKLLIGGIAGVAGIAGIVVIIKKANAAGVGGGAVVPLEDKVDAINAYLATMPEFIEILPANTALSYTTANDLGEVELANGGNVASGVGERIVILKYHTVHSVQETSVNGHLPPIEGYVYHDYIKRAVLFYWVGVGWVLGTYGED
jgi:hypothetical protein